MDLERLPLPGIDPWSLFVNTKVCVAPHFLLSLCAFKLEKSSSSGAEKAILGPDRHYNLNFLAGNLFCKKAITILSCHNNNQ